ncbi:MAG: hypothetical protein AB7J40_01035 [Candidatus Altimarinota bacterium]
MSGPNHTTATEIEQREQELRQVIEEINKRGSQQLISLVQGSQGIISSLKDALENPKKSLDMAQMKAFERLWKQWDLFKKTLYDVARQSSKPVYNRKADLQSKPAFGDYFKLINPKKDKNTQHVLHGKTAEERHDDLFDLVQLLRDLEQSVAKWKSEQSKIEAEHQERERQKITSEQAKVRDTISKLLELTPSARQFPNQELERMAALIGEKEDLEQYFKTCFKLEALEKMTFDELIGLIKDGKAEEVIRDRSRLPSLEASNDPMASLKQVWELDQMTWQRFQEARIVRERMSGLEESIVGKEKLEYDRNLDTKGAEVMKDISKGKMMEKIMELIVGETFQGSKKFRVVPVGKTMDYYGGIDMMVEVLSSQGDIRLLGIDFKSKPKDAADKNPDEERDTTKLLRIHPNSFSVLSEQARKDNAEIYGKGFSTQRIVVYNNTHEDFEKDLMTRIYKTLLTTPVDKLPPKVISRLYREAAEQQKASQRKPLSIERLCEEVVGLRAA